MIGLLELLLLLLIATVPWVLLAFALAVLIGKGIRLANRSTWHDADEDQDDDLPPTAEIRGLLPAPPRPRARPDRGRHHHREVIHA